VLDGMQVPVPGLFCAGEMVGGLFYFNYPSGTGLVSGSLFGRLAGDGAGRQAMA
jgi:tricarballylate dehydrogenase